MESMQRMVSDFSHYVRTASLAVGAYDYLQTLPFEVRISLEAWRNRRMSASFIFFMLIRYTSIWVLTLAHVGYFATTFTVSSCSRFYLLASIFKMFQAMVSQAILVHRVGFRAYSLSRKSPTVGYALLSVYLVCVPLEWMTSVYRRRISFNPAVGNCGSIGPNGAFGGWVYYCVAIIYDFIMTMFCIVFLLRLKPLATSFMARVSRMMLVDGLWYFLVLGLANVACAVFYRITDIKFASTPRMTGEMQTAAASLGYTVRWIMSQKLIIHLHEASMARRDESLADAVRTFTLTTRPFDIARALPAAARARVRALRTVPYASRFDSKAPGGMNDLTVPMSVDGRGEISDIEFGFPRLAAQQQGEVQSASMGIVSRVSDIPESDVGTRQ
ncbi:hypothetical protein MKEN_00298100 [Mycena kentingensis (nom. inval.)]|nr:hypothetical protein MKEN_00298100 [Mycena kentingensis (nom. inval.)]